MVEKGKRRVQTPPIDKLLKMYKDMVVIRTFEEQTGNLYSSGSILGLVHLYSGQEAVAVGVCAALKTDDYIASHHRGHGHCLAKGARVDFMFSELLGRMPGYCRGKGGSMHIADPATGNLGTTGIVGGSIPIATGAALSSKLRGSGQVAVSFFGDGALNQGIFFESMNIASIWNLPVIFVCENNLYGEFTAADTVTAGKHYTPRGQVFEILSKEVDGMDVLAVYQSTQSAVRRARSGKGPTFLVCNTYRFSGHHAGDQKQSYKEEQERKEWEKKDPIPNFSNWLISQNLVEQSTLSNIDREVEQMVREGLEFAQNAQEPGEDELFAHIYAD
jgi:pyruvate dehydrogenase E1 component alpha subunit